MTGEITIHGKVLPIGGLREKLLAAQRENVEFVILPDPNKAQFKLLPANLRKRVKVKFVKNYSEIFETLFSYATSTDAITPPLPTRDEGQDLAS